MAPSIGLNLRVTGYKHQGGRKYMEDEFGVAYQQTADEKDLEYAFFGIFDGHGGREAALFAKEHLMDFIVRQKNFWAEDDESVLKAIHEGFIQTHYAMWKELEKWPKTPSGLPSTAGTTASIAFIRRGKIYIGHVGDSAIVLGVQDPDCPDVWRAEPLTRDHKPESIEESERIQQCGGKVICKSGVPRVVWNRPKMGHKGPVRRSTHMDEIPFLAVARSLGDLWSYNSEENVFVVSPEPDIRVYPVDIARHRCLVLGTDGAWNMLTPQNAVSTVCQAEKANEQHMLGDGSAENRSAWINPSKQLVDTAIERWNLSKLRADNTSVVTVMLDPPGPPRAQVLKNRKRELAALNAGRDLPNPSQTSADRGSVALVTNTTAEEPSAGAAVAQPAPSASGGPPAPAAKPGGISIISRFPNSRSPADAAGHNLAAPAAGRQDGAKPDSPPRPLHDFQARKPSVGLEAGSRQHGQQRSTGRLSDSTHVMPAAGSQQDNSVQCNEVSSSDDDRTPPPPLPRRADSCASVVASSSGGKLRGAQGGSTSSKAPLKESRQALSRELNALSLLGGATATGRPATRAARSFKGRTRTRSENSSDTENDDSRLAAARKKRGKKSSSKSSSPEEAERPFVDVEMRCHELNAKIQLMERRVARRTALLNQEVKSLKNSLVEHRTQQLDRRRDEDDGGHYLRSSMGARTPPSRQLRSRTTATAGSPATPKVGAAVKRKRTGVAALLEAGPAAKTPRTVANTKPIVTRSRRAKVLQLKK